MASDQPPSDSTGSNEDDITDNANSNDEESSVELLVTSRKRRTTAGTRMSTLLAKEGDDELELLFAEDEQEEDDEFADEDAGNGSDLQLDSASSDDDQDVARADEDLEGEKELQQQTRTERQKKRKAQDIFLKPRALKKRPRVNDRSGASATPETPAARPKKKSERVSWLPTNEEGPVRASSRKQTMANKEIVHSRLVASEKRRVHQLRIMEEAAKRKEASKPKVMTQAQRMEEAARTERSNAKSLNRWEAAEKKRLEEQKAKLEALHNRQLTGPVISWWSGMARWVNGKLRQVGWKSIKEADAKETYREKQVHDRLSLELPSESRKATIDESHTVMKDEQDGWSEGIRAERTQDDTLEVNQRTAVTLVPETQGFLDGIHYYAALPEKSPGTVAIEQPSHPEHKEAPPEPPEPATPLPVTADTNTIIIPPSLPPQETPIVQYAGRNLVVLEGLDTNVQRLPELQNHILLKRRSSKGPTQSPETARELCAITEQPARYRDPATGLPYADSYAYKEIRKLANGGSRWSSLLGCYVGPTTSSGARGVPERFGANG
ncbi:MAG: hypothetical protein Q9219_006428 [cf. Caloplaca sp. 3 TL-2023]